MRSPQNWIALPMRFARFHGWSAPPYRPSTAHSSSSSGSATWPTFHDAQVVQLVLDRGGVGENAGPTLTLTVYAYLAGPGVEPNGTYVLSKECVVTFEVRRIAQVELSEFNDQNALWELAIMDRTRDQLEWVKFEVVLASSHGVGGRFSCHDAVVCSVEPWEWGRNPPVGSPTR